MKNKHVLKWLSKNGKYVGILVNYDVLCVFICIFWLSWRKKWCPWRPRHWFWFMSNRRHWTLQSQKTNFPFWQKNTAFLFQYYQVGDCHSCIWLNLESYTASQCDFQNVKTNILMVFMCHSVLNGFLLELVIWMQLNAICECRTSNE